MPTVVKGIWAGHPWHRLHHAGYNWGPRGRETGLLSSSSSSTQEPKNRAEVPSASRRWRRTRDGNCSPLTMSLSLLSVFSKKPNHFVLKKDDLDQHLYFKNKETEAQKRSGNPASHREGDRPKTEPAQASFFKGSKPLSAASLKTGN